MKIQPRPVDGGSRLIEIAVTAGVMTIIWKETLKVQNENIGLLVMAAGRGTRMGEDKNKLFLLLGGVPVIIHTLRNLQAGMENLNVPYSLVLVVHPEEQEIMKTLLGEYHIQRGKYTVVNGGKDRQQSVFFGLEALEEEVNIVFIHDGARPFVTLAVLQNCLNSVRETGTACVGVPVKDTIKQVATDRTVEKTIPRENLWQVQTPQAFRRDIIVAAHEKAIASAYMGTDDASLVEHLDLPVRMVQGGYTNLKITTPEDLQIAEAILHNRKEVTENI